MFVLAIHPEFTVGKGEYVFMSTTMELGYGIGYGIGCTEWIGVWILRFQARLCEYHVQVLLDATIVLGLVLKYTL
jgi:hypothetical protein